MQMKANRPALRQVLPTNLLDILTNIATPKRLLSNWKWSADPMSGLRKRLRLSRRLDVGWEQRALSELRRMSDHELADIGLSRSDLTLEGLMIAGTKRTVEQDEIAEAVIDLIENCDEEATESGDGHASHAPANPSAPKPAGLAAARAPGTTRLNNMFGSNQWDLDITVQNATTRNGAALVPGANNVVNLDFFVRATTTRASVSDLRFVFSDFDPGELLTGVTLTRDDGTVTVLALTDTNFFSGPFVVGAGGLTSSPHRRR